MAMANYYVPEEYRNLQLLIEDFIKLHDDKSVSWIEAINPFTKSSGEDPMATASIYLHYGYREQAIEFLCDSIKEYSREVESGGISNQVKLDKANFFLNSAKEFRIFTL